MKKFLCKILPKNRFRIFAALLVLSMSAVLIGSIAFFTDRETGHVQFTTASFSKDGYIFTTVHPNGPFIANEDVAVTITEESKIVEDINSTITMTVSWDSPDPDCFIFGNAVDEDNASIKVGDTPISKEDITVSADKKSITFDLPVQTLTQAGGAVTRDLTLHIPDSLMGTGTLSFRYDKVVLNVVAGGLNVEYTNEELNASEPKHDFTVKVGWAASALPAENGKSIMGYLRNTAANGQYEIYFEFPFADCKQSAMKDFASKTDARWTHYKGSTTKLTFAEGMTTIGDYVFPDFEKVTSLSLPERVTAIGTWAFDNTSITKLTVPAAVSSLETMSFGHINELTEITFQGSSSKEIAFPEKAGAETGAFYVYPYVDTTINGTNADALAYDWIKDLRNPPTLAARASWYNNSALSRYYVTKISVTDNYTVSGNETASWPAAVDRDGDGAHDDDIMCYLNGTELTIYGNTATRIYMNEDSYSAFFNFVGASTFDGLAMFDPCKTVNMQYLFQAGSFTELDVGGWDVSNVEIFMNTFCALGDIESIDVSKWDTGSATTMQQMFGECYELKNVDVSSWDTRNVTNMRFMFQNCDELETLDLSTKPVTMAPNAKNPEGKSYDSWDTGNVQTTEYMFKNAELLSDLDISTWDTRSIVDMQATFENSEALETLDVSPKLINLNGETIYAWDTKNVESMYLLFKNCKSLKTLDLSGWDTSGIGTGKNLSDDDFIEMFYGCTALETLNVSRKSMTGINGRNYTSWDTSNAVHMTSMFENCTSLKSLNLKDWNNSKLRRMGSMFKNCSSLTSIDFTNFTTPSAEYLSSMFYMCSALQSIDMSSWDTSHVTHMTNMFSYCSSLEKLDLSNFDTRSNIKGWNERFAQHCTSLTDITLGENFGVEGVIPSPGANGLFYVENQLATTIRGFNDAMYAYNWAADNRTVSFEGPVKIEVANQPNQTVYSSGADFDPTGMTITVHYGDGTTKNLGSNEYTLINGQDMPAGRNAVQVSYTEEGKTMYVNVPIQVGYLVTYDANGGSFDGSGSVNKVIYSINPGDKSVISKTDNINDDGTASKENYGINKNLIDIVTIPGADALEVTVTYATEHNYDWVAVYDGNITPSASNYANSVSNRLMGKATVTDDNPYGTTTKTFTVAGDTAQIFFRSDSISCSFYGYYAIVKGIGESKVISGTYEHPVHSTLVMNGWYTDKACTPGKEFNLNSLSDNVTVYAHWTQAIFTTDGNGTVTGLTTYGKTLSDLVVPSAIGEESIHTIGDYAFSGYSGLKSVKIADSVTNINFAAFYNSTGLTSVGPVGSGASVEIPNGVTTLSNSVFYGCTGLQSVEIPDTVKTIDVSAFRACSGIKSLDLGSGVTTIGENAFYGCSRLTGVLTVPESVTSLGAYAFYNNAQLTGIRIDGSIENILAYTFFGCTNVETVEIVGGVKSIGTQAFNECTSLTTIAFPSSLQQVGPNNFFSCTGLTNVYYTGNQDQWNAISVDSTGNALLTGANVTFNYNPATAQSLAIAFNPETGSLGSGAAE